MKRYRTVMLIVITLFFSSTGSLAEERMVKGTAIIGNKEIPKSLYIVPWKKAPTKEIAGRPEQSLLDEVLGPLDREVFRRQLQHYQAIETQ